MHIIDAHEQFIVHAHLGRQRHDCWHTEVRSGHSKGNLRTKVNEQSQANSSFVVTEDKSGCQALGRELFPLQISPFL
jgi:hypothetical protein